MKTTTGFYVETPMDGRLEGKDPKKFNQFLMRNILNHYFENTDWAENVRLTGVKVLESRNKWGHDILVGIEYTHQDGNICYALYGAAYTGDFSLYAD